MKKLFLILFSSTLFSALPPLAQNIRELQTLLADPCFYQFLGSGEVIKKIIHSENGYTVFTQDYVLRVDVHYLKDEQGFIGPIPFELLFYPPVHFKGKDFNL